MFTPRNWCVYKQPSRTNNDLEGWHNALNHRAGGQCGLPLYLLIELLDREAKLTAVTIRLVSDNKLKRIQRSVTRNIQAKLFENLAPTRLRSTHLYGPYLYNPDFFVFFRSQRGRFAKPKNYSIID